MARWLRDQGIAVFLLKYRVVQTTPEHRARLFAEQSSAHVNPEVPPILPLELADARAALKYVRAHAGDLGVVPTRVGMIGASAGAVVTLS